MKTVILIFLLSWSCCGVAQKSLFVRVFDLKGKKMHAGRIEKVTDTSIEIKQMGTPVSIPIATIGTIKTKRSAGNNVLRGSTIGLLSMAVVGAASAQPNASFLAYNAAEGAGMGALFGLPVGATLGGLTILFKNPKRYSINGDLTNWQSFKAITANKMGTPDRRQ